MNDTQLQQDFYKRYGISKNRVSFSKTGLLCNLIGDSQIKDFPFISCTLSMCIRTMGRRLDNKLVRLENTQTGTYDIYRLDELPNKGNEINKILKKFTSYTTFGAEILYDSTIPESFNNETAFNITLVNSLMKTIPKELNIRQKASFFGSEYFSEYVALLNSKKGWCTLVQGSRCEQLPFPLTGYKILMIRTRLKNSPQKSIDIKKETDAIKRIYPHVVSVNDITEEMLSNPALKLNNSELNRIRFLVLEREFVSIAKACLKACNTEKFADIMNRSEDCFRQLCANDEKARFTVDVLRDVGECICAKQQRDAVIAIVKEKSADNTVNLLRYSFSAAFGYEPSVCICDTCGTE